MSRVPDYDAARSKELHNPKQFVGNPQPPNSPPLSNSASPPEAPSPQNCAYTPPTSAPMSAQPSQASYLSPTLKPSTLPSASATAAATHTDKQQHLSTSKRKHEDDGEDDEGRTPNKRARTDDEKLQPVQEESQPIQPAYNIHRFCQTPHTISRPHGSMNLFQAYGLDSIAASVAREDENGNKINRIRKSYENYIKDLAGKNKADTKDDGELLQFYAWPEHEWKVQQVEGHDVMDGLSSDLLRGLEKATQMQKVDLPSDESAKWASLLEVGDYARKQSQQASQSQQSTAGGRTASVSFTAASTPDPLRPALRRGTKRSYRDDSFVGYNESFGDDIDEDMMDGEDDGRKRRKRKDTAGSPSYMNHYASVSVGNGR